eukprot:70990-Chlamydomonas_euryale.AAC.5
MCGCGIAAMADDGAAPKGKWPELVGKSKEQAEAVLLAEAPGATLQFLPEDAMVTMDFHGAADAPLRCEGRCLGAGAQLGTLLGRRRAAEGTAGHRRLAEDGFWRRCDAECNASLELYTPCPP